MSEQALILRRVDDDTEVLYRVGLPELEVLAQIPSTGIEQFDGRFLGSQHRVDFALFEVDGKARVANGNRIYRLDSAEVTCYYFNACGVVFFVLRAGPIPRMLRVSFAKPEFIKGILDPGHDEFDRNSEDLFYATYRRWQEERKRE